MLLSNERFIQEGFGEDSVSHGGGKVKSRRAARKGKGKMGPPAHKGWVEKWRKDLKIAGVCDVKDDIHDLDSSPSLFQRQFSRLVEMLIQMHLDPGDARTERDYRLQVKDRLYRFNYARSSLDLH
jgi:histone acetyltransferase 1